MAEGVNQGCPLSSILAALVLHEVVAPIDAKLKIRAANRLRLQNTGYDDAGGETHPMAYIDDAGAAVPHKDVKFFFDEFTKLGPQFGCHLNTIKTRIMTCCQQMVHPPFPPSNVNTARSLLIAFDVQLSSTQCQKFSSRPNSHPLNPIMDLSQHHPSAKISFQPPPLLVSQSQPQLPTNKLPTILMEIVTGICLPGQPHGSLSFARSFFAQRLQENMANATKLFETVSDHQTAIRLFSQCTLHKLPHLLGSEVLYCHTPILPTNSGMTGQVLSQLEWSMQGSKYRPTECPPRLCQPPPSGPSPRHPHRRIFLSHHRNELIPTSSPSSQRSLHHPTQAQAPLGNLPPE